MSNFDKLGRIADGYGGSGFPEHLQGNVNGEIPFIKVSDFNLPENNKYIVKANNYVSKKLAENNNFRVFPKNTIVIAKVGAAVYLNRKRILKQDTIIDNNMMGIIPKIDIEFLYQLLLNLDLTEKVQQGALPSLTFNLLSDIDLFVPDLPTQKRIAKILSTVDGQIEKTDAIIAKYQAIKQGMLHDLFTRGIDLTTGKLRPIPEQAPELYKSSPLGLIPKDWEAMRIDQVAEITTGCKDTQNKVENGIYPFFVRSQHIESINSYSYDGEAILTAGDGVGVGKVFHYIKGKFDFHQRVYMLSNFKLEICGKYIFEFFKTHFLAEVDKYSAKTTVDSVRLEMIAGMLIPMAKFEEQILISLKINQLDKLIAYESTNQNKLKNLKHGLMSKLLQRNK